MRGFKVVAIAIGVLIAFLLVGTVIGVIIHAVEALFIVALVAGGIFVAIKVARSGKQVSRGPKEKEIGDSYPSPTPRGDVQQYSAPVPPAAPTRPSTQDVDDELARLKREMGS
jgi:hypothetical protein